MARFQHRPRLVTLGEERALPVGVEDFAVVVTRVDPTRATLWAELILRNGRDVLLDTVDLANREQREEFYAGSLTLAPALKPHRTAVLKALTEAASWVRNRPADPEPAPAAATAPAPQDDEAELVRLVRLVRKGFNSSIAPDMPLEAVPEPLRAFVGAVARALEVPNGYVLVPLVAALATAIGRRVKLAVTEDWHERAIFWLVVVGEPGDGKSPAQKAAMKALRDIHGRRMAAYQAAKTRYELAIEVWNQTPAKSRVGEKPVEPEPRHLYTTNYTMERVGELASRNNGLLVVKDEAVSFVRSMDAYRAGKGDDREQWLSLYNGDTIQVDRMGRLLYVEEPHVNLIGGIQPAKLPKLAGEAEQDGFVDRFAWFWFDMGPRPVEEPPVDPKVRADVARLFAALTDYDDAPIADSVFAPDGPPKPADLLRFDPAAAELFKAWRQANETLRWRQRPALRTAYVKFVYLAARLAIVLHCARYPYHGRTGTALLVSRDTLANALRLAECFRAHTNRVIGRFEQLGAGVRSPEDKAFGALCQLGGVNVPTKELHQELNRHVENLTGVLLTLKDRGKVVCTVQRRDTPGRPTYLWSVNPRELSEFSELIPTGIDVDALVRQLDGDEPAGETI